ncbi:unnamed protein product [Durusdinium trenchii]|uniref:Uncharacterized protein n=2 Tax=Durusdinium trenchii TaxID=1381693 RepID=A0ABP0M889_9DINO
MLEAARLGHPKSFLNALPAELRDAVDRNVDLRPRDLALSRVNWFKFWIRRAGELNAAELELHKGFDNDAKKVMAGKRILLFQEILESIGYHDAEAANLLVEGVPLVGAVPESGVYPKVFRVAELSVETLKEQAHWFRRGILERTRSSGDEACDAFVWQETLKEVERGWLKGPFSEESLPESASISRRFGIWQKSKYRCIDDYSASLVNSTCTVLESPLLHSVDVSAALIDHWVHRLEGQATQGLLARSFDLKSAYRQLHLKSEHRSQAFRVFTLSFGWPEQYGTSP